MIIAEAFQPSSLSLVCWRANHAADVRVISSQQQWQEALRADSAQANRQGIIKNDSPLRILSKPITLKKNKQLSALVIRQDRLGRIARTVPNIGPANSGNAPVFLPVASKAVLVFATVKRKGYHAWFSTRHENLAQSRSLS